MARRVFFSFHYENDIWRAGQVRNSWVTQDDREAAGFWDSASWESVKKNGEDAVKHWINEQLKGTSVTAVLIGTDTASRKYVIYEILRSFDEGKGLLGVFIHSMKDKNGFTAPKGENPLDLCYYEENGRKKYFSSVFPTYDWVRDDGYENFGDWVEEAARVAGR